MIYANKKILKDNNFIIDYIITNSLIINFYKNIYIQYIFINNLLVLNDLFLLKNKITSYEEYNFDDIKYIIKK